MVRVKSPLVSVLIPAYNEEVYIERCLVSLLEQSYPSIEILLTDDGSSDKTAGPSLVEDLVRPLINGEAQGTSPRVEIIKNAAWSWWARARGKVRVTNPQAILVTTRKVWEKYWSTDKRAGYTSDQTIFFNSGIKPLMVDTFLYHNNPASLHECWRQFLWIGGASKRKWLFVVAFFLFPVAAVGKSVVQFVQDPFLPFIFFLPFYHSVKYVGYGLGVFRRWFTGKNIK